jgi:CubicO group peptidase (beta-lactamase class C family)
MRSMLLALAALALLATPSAAQELTRLASSEPIPPAQLESFVDGAVEVAMRKHGVVGVAVSVVQNGEVVLSKGYGYADRETGRRVDPVTTLFRIASITKTFAWITLLQQVEARHVSLDDPVNQHLPPELRIPDQGFSEPIRVRDLMTHAAGFEDRRLGIVSDREEDARSLHDLLRETRHDRVRAPGELSSYSNYDALLAGGIVEHETARFWPDVVESAILIPLGMTHTTAREPHAIRDGLPAPMPRELADELAVAYGTNGTATGRKFEYRIGPAGVISASAGDMARYMLMLLGGGSLGGSRVLGPETVQMFRTPMTAFPPNAGNWAAGFLTEVEDGGFQAFGHDGGMYGTYSSMRVLPELRLGVFVVVNTEGGEALAFSLWRALIRRFYADPTGTQHCAPDQIKAMQRYAGIYRTTRRDYGGLSGFVSSLGLLPITVTASGCLNLLGGSYAPIGTRGLFRNVAGENFSLPGGSGGFEVLIEERNGRPAVLTPAFTLERLSALNTSLTLFAAVLAASLAAVAALTGGVVRLLRRPPATGPQTTACRLEAAASVLWLAAVATQIVFLIALSRPTSVAYSYNWPPPSILAFSTLALLASLASAASAGLLPAVWAGKTGTGWGVWRKARFTVTATLFSALVALLFSWGALQPWNP